MDLVKYYELKNKLFHLDSNIEDDLILNLISIKSLQNIGKFADILRIVYFSTPAMLDEEIMQLSYNDFFNKCKNIIIKIANLSIYTYSEEDIDKIALFYCLNNKGIDQVIKEIGEEELIQTLDNVVTDETNLSQAEQFLNEELRLFLLYVLQVNPMHYQQNEDKILTQLNIAKTMTDLRQQVSRLIEKSE